MILSPRDHMELLAASLDSVLAAHGEQMKPHDRAARQQTVDETPQVLARMSEPLYMIGAMRKRDTLVTRWFFDDVTQLAVACALAGQANVTIHCAEVVSEKPPGDYVSDAGEFDRWARRMG